MIRNLAGLLFAAGLAVVLLEVAGELNFGHPPMTIGQPIIDRTPTEVGSANVVTAVVLAYRGFDTLGELSILFAAATAVGLALGARVRRAPGGRPAGTILRSGADFLFPLLLLTGLYIVMHGHLTPGGGFQGGVVLAVAFFLPVLARSGAIPGGAAIAWIEGLAGASFIGIGLWALLSDGAFLAPLLGRGAFGELFSAGTLRLLYLAVGLKVGAELAGLLGHLFASHVEDAA